MIDHLIATYGYAAVGLIVCLESFGIPLPGETTLIVAATYAGTTHRLSPYAIFAVAAGGAIVGDSIGYWIGDKGGYRLLLRWGHKIRIDPPKIKVARYLFVRHGGKVVFFGRFVSVLRAYAAFLAGTTRMKYRRFLFFNASGGILWAAIYTSVGYLAGQWIRKASTPIDVALGVIAAAAIVAGIVLIRRRFKDLERTAEEMFPGPLER